MKYRFVLFLLLLPSLLNAQSFTVAAEKMNIAYIGIDNPLTIVADNCSCKDLLAATENGTLIKKDSCRFIYNPTNVGVAKIVIQKKQHGKLIKIGEQELRCKSIPDPQVVVGNKGSGEFSLTRFKVQQGVMAIVEQGIVLNIRFTVVSFYISLWSNNQLIYEEKVHGNRFSANTIAAFNKLKVGDVVKIENIDVFGIEPLHRLTYNLTFQMR